MPSLGFRELVSQLPRGDRDRLLPKRLPSGMSRITIPNPCFIEPDFIAETEIRPNTTSVVLLSAPGAVGKSTVAAELARLSGATLWDLSKIQVGSSTFIGTIYGAYDELGHGVLNGLKAGNYLFILDALDEAQVRAGSSNFDAFLDDLIEILRQPRSKPAIVLLARSDTADWIELKFIVENVPCARFQIANFNDAQAIEFIDKRLDAIRSVQSLHLVHRQQRAPFIQARSRLFSLIFDLLSVRHEQAWTDPRVHNFLGYAPVLEALTDYLNVSNYSTIINELQSEISTTHDPWEFLAEIVSRLLLRESNKVQDALRSSLGGLAKETGWTAWNELYRDSEQCRRVLEYSLNLPSTQTEQELPNRLAEEYETKIRLTLPQHPFLAASRRFANVVFKEYLYAWGVTSTNEELARSLRETMRDRQEPFLPSQLFSHFVLRSGGDSIPVLDGQDFGVLYDSLLSRAEVAEDVDLTIFQSGDSLRVSAILDRASGAGIECELLDTGSGIQVWRQLRNADIDISAPLELGLPGQRFSLGPSVILSCTKLMVSCDDLDVDTSEPIQLRADIYQPGPQNLHIRIRKGSPIDLVVFWPNIIHPWASFRGSESETVLRLKEDMRGDALRKFILMFRRQRTRKLGTVMSARWSPDQLGTRDELLDLARQMGVVTRTGRGRDEFLVFNSEYDTLMSLLDGPPKLSPTVLKFVTSYFGDEKTQRILR